MIQVLTRKYMESIFTTNDAKDFKLRSVFLSTSTANNKLRLIYYEIMTFYDTAICALK